MSYHLSNIPGLMEFVNSGKLDESHTKYYSVHEYSTKANEAYSIIKYNKEYLTCDLIGDYGLLRSVVFSGPKMVSFSPQKSLAPEYFMNKYPVIQDSIVAEEFIEGTMVNVFFDPTYGVSGCWQIATRNTVGAEVTFYKWTKKTFSQMFMEACISNNFNVQTLNPRFCYSFVLQHPENRIVIPFKEPQLYLVGVYEIVQTPEVIDVIEQNLSEVRVNGLWSLTRIRFPENYKYSSYTELIEKFASPNTPYNIMGIVIKNVLTGERTKIRNPVYEEVRQLRGNQPKLQYQYLTLRHSGKLSEYLKFYPETKPEFSKFRDQLHLYTNTLYNNYISCYVKKEKPLKEFSDQYRTHMYNLHQQFLNDLRPNKLCVTNSVVIKYVNSLPPSLLMYCLNFHMRKRLIDTIKANTLLL